MSAAFARAAGMPVNSDTQVNGRARQPTRAEAEEQERDFFALKERGFSTEQIRQRLEITQRRAETLSGHYDAQTRAGSSDTSCPKFAHHDKHVREVMKAGGFRAMPKLSELRSARP